MITQAVLRAYIDEVQHDEFIKGSECDARQHTRVHTMSTTTILMIYMCIKQYEQSALDVHLHREAANRPLVSATKRASGDGGPSAVGLLQPPWW